MKPYAESCDQNRAPILSILKQEIEPQHRSLLEIGSGTGQHAVYFAPEFPTLTWQSSDVTENIPGIRQWLDEFAHANLPPPLILDTLSTWPADQYDLIFSANTTHIMSWQAVVAMFNGIAHCLKPQGKLMLYGPFNYDGQYTSDSNAQFDQWLKRRDPQSGIRDFSELDQLARKSGLKLLNDHTMPVNNRLLVWQALF